MVPALVSSVADVMSATGSLLDRPGCCAQWSVVGGLSLSVNTVSIGVQFWLLRDFVAAYSLGTDQSGLQQIDFTAAVH
jgi:hypothetical protein